MDHNSQNICHKNLNMFAPISSILLHHRHWSEFFRILLRHWSELFRIEVLNIPSTVSVWSEAADARPEKHPGVDNAGDEALCPAGDPPLLLHWWPHEGQQHDLHSLSDKAGAQEAEQEHLKPAEAEQRQSLVRRVLLGPAPSSRHAGRNVDAGRRCGRSRARVK